MKPRSCPVCGQFMGIKHRGKVYTVYECSRCNASIKVKYNDSANY